jgi:uncharacterized protein YbaA (DUF1428 family)
MTYVEGFVAAVPTANRDEYVRHAAGAWPMFREFGVRRHVEAWADDVPDGKVTDFRMAVQAREDEAVVFSWFEYPSREGRDAANQKIMSDPRMKELGATMPFDGRRMIVSGFRGIVEHETGGRMGYVDGFVLPVPSANEEAYRALAAKGAPIFAEHGATRIVEALGDDLMRGTVTDFYRAVKAQDDENVVFAWIEWPSKEARVAGWEKVMADERMKPDHDNMPFDGKRLFWGGFEVLLDKQAGAE